MLSFTESMLDGAMTLAGWTGRAAAQAVDDAIAQGREQCRQAEDEAREEDSQARQRAEQTRQRTQARAGELIRAREEVQDHMDQLAAKIAYLTEFARMYAGYLQGPAAPGGGAYADIRQSGYEAHHMPAKSALPPGAQRLGASIRMDPQDHILTASFGHSAYSLRYTAAQRELVGRGGYLRALKMDVDNIRSLFGDRYDGQIRSMLAYVPAYLARHDL